MKQCSIVEASFSADNSLE